MIRKLLASVVLLAFATFILQAQNTISGTVTDAETGEPSNSPCKVLTKIIANLCDNF